jgi:hypothetical protein
MGDAVKIEGLAELRDLLGAGTKRAAQGWLTKLMKSCGDIIVPTLEDAAPQEWGTLRDSIIEQRLRTVTDGDGMTIEVVYGPKKGISWGSHQEFGWHNRGHIDYEDEMKPDKKGHLRKIAKREDDGKTVKRLSDATEDHEGTHWMQNAWESKQDSIMATIEAEVEVMCDSIKMRRGNNG